MTANAPDAHQFGPACATAAASTAPDVADHISWVQADLTHWEPGDRRYDLVTSHNVHVPGPAADLFDRLASWVAPGGTLLVVGHDDAHPAGAGVRLEQVAASLPADQWEIVVAEPRHHTVPRPDGTDVTPRDVVVRARRRGTSLP